MSLTVLSVAYPMAAVSPDAVGGAEQVLSQLDAALVRLGHRSIVIAREGSTVAGRLVSVPAPQGILDEALPAAREHHRRAILQTVQRERVDVVHLHGVDFHHYLPPPGVPTLATLHCPPEWYAPEALYPARPDTWLHCVSRRQHDSMGANPRLLAPIENGVHVPVHPPPHAKRDFALMLCRIAPEKGIHLAIAAAKRAGVPLLIAGRVYDYLDHRRYYAEEIEPQLDPRRRFIGPAGLARKRRLLAAARCLLVPSLVPETSSLVAREAIAMGTPVVAFGAGALVDTVEHGRTGFIVADEAEMAEAIERASCIDRDTCRAVARERFALDRMVEEYLGVYETLAAAGRRPQASGAR